MGVLRVSNLEQKSGHVVCCAEATRRTRSDLFGYCLIIVGLIHHGEIFRHVKVVRDRKETYFIMLTFFYSIFRFGLSVVCIWFSFFPFCLGYGRKRGFSLRDFGLLIYWNWQLQSPCFNAVLLFTYY